MNNPAMPMPMYNPALGGVYYGQAGGPFARECEDTAHIVKSALGLPVALGCSPLSLHQSEVSLAEAVALLWQNDETGIAPSFSYRGGNHTRIAAALLLDLLLIGRLGLQLSDVSAKYVDIRRQKTYIVLLDRTETNSKCHNRVLELLANGTLRCELVACLLGMISVPNLTKNVFFQLAERGIIDVVRKKKMLGLYTQVSYPTRDPKYEERLVNDLRAVLRGVKQPDAYLTIALRLACAMGHFALYSNLELKAAPAIETVVRTIRTDPYTPISTGSGACRLGFVPSQTSSTSTNDTSTSGDVNAKKTKAHEYGLQLAADVSHANANDTSTSGGDGNASAKTTAHHTQPALSDYGLQMAEDVSDANFKVVENSVLLVDTEELRKSKPDLAALLEKEMAMDAKANESQDQDTPK